jgi:hypothetical protein
VVSTNHQHIFNHIVSDEKSLLFQLITKLDGHSQIRKWGEEKSSYPGIKNIFDMHGTSIKHTKQLSNKTEMWVTFGDAWKNPFSE